MFFTIQKSSSTNANIDKKVVMVLVRIKWRNMLLKTAKILKARWKKLAPIWGDLYKLYRLMISFLAAKELTFETEECSLCSESSLSEGVEDLEISEDSDRLDSYSLSLSLCSD
jgi:hypothetical protein